MFILQHSSAPRKALADHRGAAPLETNPMGTPAQAGVLLFPREAIRTN